MKNKSITKYNGLIEASYRLSLNEARIVFYGISLINPLSDNFTLEYKIDVKLFSEMFNINGHNVYSLIRDAVMDKFWEREFTFPTENNKKMRVRWLIGIEYADNEGYLKVFINPKIKPFLHQLRKNFTTYYIEKIANFKSVYSVRFYEYSIMSLNKTKQDKCQFKLKVDEVKKRLELKEKYNRFSNFKAFVLEPARKEINKHSDLRFSYRVIKLGRSPHEIEFTVSKKGGSRSPSTRLPSYKVPPVILEKAKAMIYQAGNQWDIYALEQQFYDYVKKKGPPERLEGAFLGFIRKKIENPPPS